MPPKSRKFSSIHELQVINSSKGQIFTKLETKLFDYTYSKSAAEITMHFYKDDFKTQIQRFKLWTVDNEEIITSVFPADDWNKVVITTDSTDELAFDVFKLYYGDELVIDVVRIEKCGVSWFDNKDLSSTTSITGEIFECYHKTATNHRVFTLESYHQICPEGFQQFSDDPKSSCYHHIIEKRTREEHAEFALKLNGFLAKVPSQKINDKLSKLVLENAGNSCSLNIVR
jgi:hypothetical protein